MTVLLTIMVVAVWCGSWFISPWDRGGLDTALAIVVGGWYIMRGIRA